MTVARFVNTASFLINYCNGHAKSTHPQLKTFRDYFQQHIIPVM